MWRPTPRRRGVHGGGHDGPGDRVQRVVLVDELRSSGEVLCDAPVGRALQCLEKQAVVLRGRPGLVQRDSVKPVRHIDPAMVQERPDLRTRVLCAGCREGRIGVGVVGPQRAQDQDGASAQVLEERGERGGEPFPRALAGTKVVLGLVEPDHGSGADVLQFGEGGFGASGVEGVPRPPAVLCEGLNGLPARSRLPRRGGADKNGHAAPAGLR